MREITPAAFKVYTFEELSEAAQKKAVAEISEKLNGAWWDDSDLERLRETMRFAFARELQAPGSENFGPGDYPGIDGVELGEWDLERGQSIEFKGRLTRENAPALPWVDGIPSVLLGDRNYGMVYVEIADQAVSQDLEDALDRAVRDAMQAAWKDGRAEMDYMEGDEYAEGWIEGNLPEFYEDGTYYFG